MMPFSAVHKTDRQTKSPLAKHHRQQYTRSQTKKMKSVKTFWHLVQQREKKNFIFELKPIYSQRKNEMKYSKSIHLKTTMELLY